MALYLEEDTLKPLGNKKVVIIPYINQKENKSLPASKKSILDFRIIYSDNGISAIVQKVEPKNVIAKSICNIQEKIINSKCKISSMPILLTDFFAEVLSEPILNKQNLQ